MGSGFDFALMHGSQGDGGLGHQNFFVNSLIKDF
jgi:hypothetical protein